MGFLSKIVSKVESARKAEAARETDKPAPAQGNKAAERAARGLEAHASERASSRKAEQPRAEQARAERPRAEQPRAEQPKAAAPTQGGDAVQFSDEVREEMAAEERKRAQEEQERAEEQAVKEASEGRTPEGWEEVKECRADGQPGARTYRAPDGTTHEFSEQEGTKTHKSTETEKDGGTRSVTTATRPDGTVETTDAVKRQDGSTEETHKVPKPDGSVEVTTSKTRTSDQSLEQAGGSKPPEGAPALPPGQRDPTQVKEVEVKTVGADGREEVQSRVTEVSQTSHDVEQKGLGGKGAVLPEGVQADPKKSGVTQTVTTVEARDPKTGELVTTRGESTDVKIVGNRDGGGEVSARETTSWNDKGTTTTSEIRGYKREEFEKLSSSGFGVRVGDQETNLKPQGISEKNGLQHYNDYGGKIGRDSWAQQFNPIGGGDTLDMRTTVERPKDGKASETVTVGALDPGQDGKSVTRSEDGDGNVFWNHKNTKNGGKDVYQSTTKEGTDFSQYNEYHRLNDNEFTSHTATYVGGEVADMQNVSRRVVTDEQIDADKNLSPERKEFLKKQPGPHSLDSVHSEKQAVVGEDGQVKQDGHYLDSSSYSAANGAGVSHTLYNTATQGGSIVETLSDPNSETPAVVEMKDGKGGSKKVEMRGQDVYVDGQKLEGGLPDTGGGASGVPAGMQLAIDAAGGATMDGGRLAQFGPFAGALGAATGAVSTIAGIQQGDWAQGLQGAGNTLASAPALAKALSSLPNSAFSGLSEGGLATAGKILGPVGGAMIAGVGVHGIFTQENGPGRASSVFTAASGGFLAATPFFPPAAIGAAVCTLGDIMIKVGTNSDTAPIDSRVWEGNSQG